VGIQRKFFNSFKTCNVKDSTPMLLLGNFSMHHLTGRTVVISAYGQKGDVAMALKLFQDMRSKGYTPDVVTWYERGLE